jgi:amino acid transporter
MNIRLNLLYNFLNFKREEIKIMAEKIKSTKGKLGFLSILLMGINGIVGTGIFLLPNTVFGLVGNAGLFVVIIDALLVLAIALSFAEVAGLFDKNGGAYIYAKESLGDFVGYIVGFMSVAIRVIAWATLAVAFITTLGSIVPFFASSPGTQIGVVVLLIILGAVQLSGVENAKWLLNIVTIGKLVPLLFFIFVGLFFIKGGNLTPLVPNDLKTSALGSAAITLLYAFTGFETLPIAAEDMDNPKKNLPKALFISILLIAIGYFLIIFNTIGILGNKIDVTGAHPAIQAALGKAIGSFGTTLVFAGSLISMLGINIGAAFSSPRAVEAMATQGVLPKIIAKKNSKNVPYIAIVITVLITILIALSGTFAQLAAISVISRFAQYIPTMLAVIIFRKKLANAPRTFKLPFGITIPVIGIIVSLWLLFQDFITPAGPTHFLWGFGGIAIAAVFYLITKLLKKEAK